MANLRVAAIGVLVLACACMFHESQAGKLEWREIPQVKGFLNSHPVMKAMTEGPLDDLIDLLIALLIYIINIILAQPMQLQLGSLSSRIQALEGSR